MHLDDRLGVGGHISRIVADVLRTNAHDNFLADVALINEFLHFFGGHQDLAVAKQRVHLAVFGLQGDIKHIHLRAADKAGHKLIVGIVVVVLGGIDLLDEAVLHDADAGSHRHGFGLIVGNVDEGGLQALVQLGDLGTHGNAQLGIQVGQRFVHQEDLGLTHDGAAEGDALALAAGQCLGLAVEQVLDIQDAGGGFDAALDLILGGLAQLEAEGHVIIHRHVGVQGVVLENHGDVAVLGRNIIDQAVADVKLAVGNLFQAGNHAQGGGLAAAGGTDQNDKFLILDVQGKIAYSGHVTGINLVDVL